MKSYMARRICRVEKQTDNFVSYRESAELGLALLVQSRDGQIHR